MCAFDEQQRDCVAHNSTSGAHLGVQLIGLNGRAVANWIMGLLKAVDAATASGGGSDGRCGVRIAGPVAVVAGQMQRHALVRRLRLLLLLLLLLLDVVLNLCGAGLVEPKGVI